ncbi:MAG: hypothetical protein ACRDY7_19010, partial [Acidimicrobiia bacterium]
MSISDDDLVVLLEVFAASDWDDLELISGDVRLAVSKRADGAARAAGLPAATSPASGSGAARSTSGAAARPAPATPA